MLNVLRCQLTYYGQVVTNAEARFNKSLRPRKPKGSLGRTAQDGHLDSHTVVSGPTMLLGVKQVQRMNPGIRASPAGTE